MHSRIKRIGAPQKSSAVALRLERTMLEDALQTAGHRVGTGPVCSNTQSKPNIVSPFCDIWHIYIYTTIYIYIYIILFCYASSLILFCNIYQDVQPPTAFVSGSLHSFFFFRGRLVGLDSSNEYPINLLGQSSKTCGHHSHTKHMVHEGGQSQHVFFQQL